MDTKRDYEKLARETVATAIQSNEDVALVIAQAFERAALERAIEEMTLLKQICGLATQKDRDTFDAELACLRARLAELKEGK